VNCCVPQTGAFDYRLLLKQVTALLLLSLFPTLLAALLHPRKPSWSLDTLAPGEVHLKQALDSTEPVLWIDARSLQDFAQAHIPGALPLNMDQWDSQLPDVLQAWQPGQMVIVYCSSRGCRASHEVAERLRQLPLPDVFVLHGGWETWQKAHP
jgi:rhodanese-related sulfurtransferase